jgi:hypothetical protein
LAIESNISMYITAPYVFQSREINGQSVTLPLVDPRSGEYVGQVLNDFYSHAIFRKLDNTTTPLTEGGFPVLIAVQGRPEENTILGPGYNMGDNATAISRVVLRQDYDCNSALCEARIHGFGAIVGSMNSGASDTTIFTRESQNGGEELVHISYAPVKLKGIRPLDSSDFGRGVEVVEYDTYSLGLCETQDGLLQPFKKIEHDISSAIRWVVGCVATGIFFGALFVIYMSYAVTMSVTEPMLNLLGMIRCINR